jgi:hypothetical protein
MPPAPNHTRRRSWSSVLMAFVTLTWLSLMAFQSYSSGRWLIPALLVTFILGLLLVARKLSPATPPPSMDQQQSQVTIGRILHATTWVAIGLALWGYLDKTREEHPALTFPLLGGIIGAEIAAITALLRGHLWALAAFGIGLLTAAMLYPFLS